MFSRHCPTFHQPWGLHQEMLPGTVSKSQSLHAHWGTEVTVPGDGMGHVTKNPSWAGREQGLV